MSDPFAITTAEQLAAAYEAPHPRFLAKVTDRLEATSRAFIAASPFCILATAGRHGPHATPRGDAPGFVVPLDETTLALPDRRGNNRLDGLRDILDDPQVALLFLIPGVGETLRVHGTARITTDPALRARFAVAGRRRPRCCWSRAGGLCALRQGADAVRAVGGPRKAARRADQRRDDRGAYRRRRYRSGAIRGGVPGADQGAAVLSRRRQLSGKALAVFIRMRQGRGEGILPGPLIYFFGGWHLSRGGCYPRR